MSENLDSTPPTEIDFKKLIDLAQDGFSVYSAKGELLYRNKALAMLLGATAQLGESIYQFKKEGRFSSSPVITAIQKKHNISGYVQHLYGKYLFVTALPVFQEDTGVLQYIIVTQRDISDYFKFEEELRKSKITAMNYRKQLLKLSEKMNEKNKYDIICESQQMQTLLDTFVRISASNSTVLLLGETGVGKTMLARFIHKKSARANEPFISLNCSTIPLDLVESELFGYEKGSFTGANMRKIGLFEAAEGGTIFLDEISELPLALQAKLLSVLEEHKIRRIGSVREIDIDVRVIAATNRNLKQMITDGRFRSDLFYRLNSLTFEIPPLRERPSDLARQIKVFLDKQNQAHGTRKILSEETFRVLLTYTWPGNSRELYNAIARLVELSCSEVIQLSSLPDEILLAKPEFDETRVRPTFQEHMENAEKTLLAEAKRRYCTIRRIADALGMTPATVCRKLSKYRL